MTYLARGLGGINGSGVYPDSRPQIDVGGLVDSVARAFQLTRNGVVQRAIMQANADRARAQEQRAQNELNLRQRQVTNQESVQAADLLSKGYEPVDPNSPPLTPSGKPQPLINLAGQSYLLNETKTPEGKRRTALTGYNTSLPVGDAKRLTDQQINLLASDPAGYEQWVQRQAGLLRQPIDPLSPEGIKAREGLIDYSARLRTADKTPKQLTLPQRENAATDFADRMVEAAHGDPIQAMAAAERDMPTARALNMKRADYYAAAQRYKERQQKLAKSNGLQGLLGPSSDVGAAPSAAPTRPDLPTRVQQLKAAGYTKAQAAQQLKQEGYNIQ